MSALLNKIHIFICIIAAAVTVVASILQETPLFVMAYRLVIVITLFYVIGLVVRFYLRKRVFPTDKGKPAVNVSDIDVQTDEAVSDSGVLKD